MADKPGQAKRELDAFRAAVKVAARNASERGHLTEDDKIELFSMALNLSPDARTGATFWLTQRMIDTMADGPDSDIRAARSYLEANKVLKDAS